MQNISLRALRERVARQRQDFDRGVYDESVRTLPRWMVQEVVPSARLRPGAYKQMLREEEEAALPLVGEGVGVVGRCAEWVGWG